jgi:glucose-6-phosphate 1-dehydrogenase
MIDRLVIFGATGDLTARYLLPALAALQDAGKLPDGFAVVGTGRQPLSTDQYREWASNRLDEHGRACPRPARLAVVAALRYQPADVTDPDGVAPLIAGDRPVAVYLALPPALFPTVVTTLQQAGLPAGSRLVLEKPFGEDLDSAVRLNRLLAELLPEQAVFRVDHFLAMTTVQNVLGSRLANRIFEPIWNSAHIEEVAITWEETLALEGRASYYDGAGALKDMVQNHLLQLLCLVAMEPPLSISEKDLRDRKLDTLRAIRPLTEDDVRVWTRRARYTAGRINGHDVPAYVDEEGVDPDRGTETFAEVVLHIDNWRWSGTRFRLRTGKAFGADRKEVAVHFRPVPYLTFGRGEDARPNVLRFGLEPEGMALDLVGTGPRPRTLTPFTLAAQTEPARLPAYGQLLLDVLTGDPTLSIRGDEAEQAWRVLTPVLSAWEKDVVPLHEYAAGSAGPPPI